MNTAIKTHPTNGRRPTVGWFLIALVFVFILEALPIFEQNTTASADDRFWIRKGTSTASRRKAAAKPPKADVKKTNAAGGSTSTGSATRRPQPARSSEKSGSSKKTASDTSRDSQFGGGGSSVKNSIGPGVNGATIEKNNPGSPTDNVTNKPQPTVNQGPYVGLTYSDPVVSKWRVATVLVTGSKPVTDVFAHIPVPKAWPEQTVKIFDEDLPVEFEVQNIQELDGVNLLILRGRSVPRKKKVAAMQIYQVTTRKVNPPPDTTIFSFPDPKDRKLKAFLGNSQGINPRHKKVRKLAETFASRTKTDWEMVESIYDWVRENVEQRSMSPFGASNAISKQFGAAEDCVGAFIALCRANKIPARTVYTNGSQHAEFLLVDPDNNPHWIPCDITGLRAFGKIVEPRVILQKGDNIRVPGRKQNYKFVAAFGRVLGVESPRIFRFYTEPAR